MQTLPLYSSVGNGPRRRSDGLAVNLVSTFGSRVPNNGNSFATRPHP